MIRVAINGSQKSEIFGTLIAMRSMAFNNRGDLNDQSGD